LRHAIDRKHFENSILVGLWQFRIAGKPGAGAADELNRGILDRFGLEVVVWRLHRAGYSDIAEAFASPLAYANETEILDEEVRPWFEEPKSTPARRSMMRIMLSSTEGRSSIRVHSPMAEPSKAYKHWSGRRDSNSRPPAPKAGALPGCATPRHAPSF
jgi:hypothetical protein